MNGRWSLNKWRNVWVCADCKRELPIDAPKPAFAACGRGCHSREERAAQKAARERLKKKKESAGALFDIGSGTRPTEN